VPDADVRVGGRYRLGRKLAAGGMGTVWEGWDERLHRTIAIKRLHLDPWLSDAQRNVSVQRTMREARLTARLHHPNVVQVYDIVDDADTPSLIMEYVPSRSLHELVGEHGPLRPAQAAEIGAQVAAGLAAAHAAGIVHRDVKPGNVLITADGAAKVSDFGISHAFDDVTVTSTGMLVGTPAYLAPEVARGAAPTFASDVYALGATLYLAVEGRAPFGTDENPIAVLHRAASGEWDPPQRAGELDPLLHRMMARDPAVRPSMQDVAAVLGTIGNGPVPPATTQVIRTRPATPPPAPAAVPARRRPGLIAILAGVVALVIAGVLALVLVDGGGGGSGRPDRSAARPPAAGSAGGSAHHGASEHKGTGGAGTPSAGQLAGAIDEYFQLVPGDLNAGWSRLTPHFQQTRAQGRQSYDSYWNSVGRVDVSDVQGLPPDAVIATLVYHYKDGRVVTQQTRFRLVTQGGVLKIDEES
jgi:eukaryotic-like serine/threonine-protein kinase